MRTSGTHPLRIDAVQAERAQGRIGITFCPGKRVRPTMPDGWARDLDTDLDAIREWGAVAVITLTEQAELEALDVAQLGHKVRQRQMTWYHLPIADGTIPAASFEASWQTAGEDVRARLRNGFDVLVHCQGGLGRAGTIAARLLIELGKAPQAAVDLVRQSRPGAIETAEQLDYVLRQNSLPPRAPRNTRTMR